MRKQQSVIGLIIALCCFTGYCPPTAEAGESLYIQTLINRAAKQKTAGKRFWHLLLHYRENRVRGYTSETDGRGFFNSPHGKTDPRAELEATIKGFFKDPASLRSGQEHPQCNFPARYKWLQRELSIDPLKLPDQKCERLDEWTETLDPERITLVFASYYMNNPASMFGHTLIRIDRKSTGERKKLLNYGTNYSITLDTDSALLYTLKGLFGLFEGRFMIFPYYTKVKEYSNWESRDLWEYELNFNEDQMNYLLLHLWELGGTYFDYYYFQENCSYHLLSLLEIADPGLHLTDQFSFSVIPSDTVKVVMENRGLVSKVVYRPSILSKMRHKMLQMTEREEQLFYDLHRDPAQIKSAAYQALSVRGKALVLDSFLDYALYKSMQRKDEENTFDKQTTAILIERSTLQYRVKKTKEITRFSTPPESGHGSDRIKIGTGGNGEESFREFSYRPAYHDLLAQDPGYAKDSQILFFDITGRYYHKQAKIKLESFKVVEIISLTPYDPLAQKNSWRLDIGIDTIKDLDCNSCNSFKAGYGMGYTYKQSFSAPLVLYSFLDAEAELSDQLRDKYRLGGGGTVGMLLDITNAWRTQVQGDYRHFPFGEKSDYYTIALNQRYSLSQNFDLRLELERVEEEQEWVVAANYYF